MTEYVAAAGRYEGMVYRRCGASGLKLPVISFGLWQNFGGPEVTESCRAMVLRAFDLGITHIDLANNYGPPPGSAEENFGRILKADLGAYRDELVVSTKAGYDMWPGPYGEWGSRKYMLASLDQSLRRMGLEYVDIFYSHRLDPETPLEETMGALAQAVKVGKALYVGVSNYPAAETAEAVRLLGEMGVRCLIHQPKYSMFVRTPEEGLLDVLRKKGMGAIAFSPLAQGLLTNRYAAGVEAGSRAARMESLKSEDVEGRMAQVRALAKLAAERGQTLAQMAIAWVLRDSVVTSALVGASSVAQLEQNVQALEKLEFAAEELAAIEGILG